MLLYDPDKIRHFMEKAHLSGNQLAKKAGISGPSLHAILNGETKEPAFSTLAAIAAALGVQLPEITKGKLDKGQDLSSQAAAVFAKLSPENQAAMLIAMQSLAEYRKK